MAFKAMLAGAWIGVAGFATRPVEMLTLSLRMLTPLVEFARNDVSTGMRLGHNENKVVAHGTHHAATKWNLPPLTTLRESCYLLERTLEHDLFVCMAPDPEGNSRCELSREISDYYGEPMFLCTRSIA